MSDSVFILNTYGFLLTINKTSIPFSFWNVSPSQLVGDLEKIELLLDV